MDFLSLLSEILRIFADLIPRFHGRPPSTGVLVVDAFAVGVRTVQNRPVLYVPILDHVELWETTAVPQDPDIQTITIKSGEAVTINAAYEYQITDPIACREHYGSNYLASMNVAVRAALTQMVQQMDRDDLPGMQTESVADQIAESFASFGVLLLSLSVEECATCRSTRHWGMNLTQPES